MSNFIEAPNVFLFQQYHYMSFNLMCKHNEPIYKENMWIESLLAIAIQRAIKLLLVLFVLINAQIITRLAHIDAKCKAQKGLMLPNNLYPWSIQ